MATAAPPLAIGVPVYNGERYLAQALAGIRAQTFTDFEVLIADNASTDRTGEIAQEEAAVDPRIRYLRRDQNIGLVANFNETFHQTSGEFFAWHAADGVARPEFYKVCVGLLREHIDAAAAVTAIELISSEGESLGADPEPIRADHPDRAVRFAELASFRHYCQFCYGIYRRSMMARTRMMQRFWTMDRLFLAELALQGRLVRDSRQLYAVREHEERVTTGARANFYAGLYSPRRGTTLAYARELAAAIDHAGLDPAERGRVRRALRGWKLQNAHRLARSAAGALVSVGARAVTRSGRRAS